MKNYPWGVAAFNFLLGIALAFAAAEGNAWFVYKCRLVPADAADRAALKYNAEIDDAKRNETCNFWNSTARMTQGPGVYHCDPKTGEFIFDKEATAWDAETRDAIERHRHDLASALVTRVLSDEEMKEVESRGFWLLCPEAVSFRQADKVKEFADDLLQQYRLRTMARNHEADGDAPR